jgi:hypothetical protein
MQFPKIAKGKCRMKCAQLPIFYRLLMAALFGFTAGSAVGAETLWNCKRPNGSTFLTNQEKDTVGYECRVLQQMPAKLNEPSEHQITQWRRGLRSGDRVAEGLIVEIKGSIALIQQLEAVKWMRVDELNPIRGSLPQKR